MERAGRSQGEGGDLPEAATQGGQRGLGLGGVGLCKPGSLVRSPILASRVAGARARCPGLQQSSGQTDPAAGGSWPHLIAVVSWEASPRSLELPDLAGNGGDTFSGSLPHTPAPSSFSGCAAGEPGAGAPKMRWGKVADEAIRTLRDPSHPVACSSVPRPPATLKIDLGTRMCPPRRGSGRPESPCWEGIPLGPDGQGSLGVCWPTSVLLAGCAPSPAGRAVAATAGMD